jgi:hypothetical protein
MKDQTELKCIILVKGTFGLLFQGEKEPDMSRDLFTVELTPKNVAVPEGFCIWNTIPQVKDLEEYLASGIDDYSWSQNYHGEPEETEFIATLPAPLNNVDADLTLTWKRQDICFDQAAYTLLKIYHSYLTDVDLQKNSIGELRIIARVKKAHLSDKKPKQIQNILVKESEGEWANYGIKGDA